MTTKKILISAVLASNLIFSRVYAQASFWGVFEPFRTSRTQAKLKTDLEENQILPGFSLIQNDSFLAVRPLVTAKTYKPKRVYTVAATGYSSTPEETDHTPFITASGIHVRDGVIAANFLPFGTIIKIPELFGDKIFVVEDRMNKRYLFNIDIWFSEKGLAKEFGIKTVKIEIL